MSDNVATLPRRASIRIGCVVELMSGGAPMTVIERTSTSVKCVWHDVDGCLNEATFPTTALQVKECQDAS